MMKPFGLTNAPSTFQALRNDVFRDYVGKFMFVYLDDVLIFSRSAEAHKEHAELVLKHMRDKEQFAKLSKCEFSQRSVKFLGHVAGQEALSKEKKKVKCAVAVFENMAREPGRIHRQIAYCEGNVQPGF
jgi:Reverse transcriptase (RNA-dependent DNA polymerase)